MKIPYAAIFLLSSACCLAGEVKLEVGSDAPSIDIEHWMNGKTPIKGFKPGKVYVIEFWATWCGPCIASIPHLKEIQERHKEDVVVVSVSDEDREKVEKFLETKSSGTSYGEITSSYWLATDPDRSVYDDYMRASGMFGIPTSFIVGKTGKIEWLGHPIRIDEPLAMVLAGTWDREEFAEQRRINAEIQKKMSAALTLSSNGKKDEALAAIDRLIAESTSPEMTRKLDSARGMIERGNEAKNTQATYASACGPRSPIEKLKAGEYMILPVTGSDKGFAWGSEVYTGDSSIEVSAVHAGALKVGERGYVVVTRVEHSGDFKGGESNGATTRSWGKYPTAFKVERHLPK